jgi:hypothetical protein
MADPEDTLPTDPAEVVARLVERVNRFLEEHRHWDDPEWQLFKSDWARRLRRVEPGAAFEALVRMLEQCPGLVHQRLAAELMHRMGRRCPLPRESVVRRIAANFNLSAKSVPDYLAEQFGSDAVLADPKSLDLAATDDDHRVRIRTLRWWLGDDV